MWRDLFQRLTGKPAPDPVYQIGDLQLVPSSVTEDRVRAVLDDTFALKPLFTPTPPPLRGGTISIPGAQDYAPDPDIELVLDIASDAPFSFAALRDKGLHKYRDLFENPIWYIRLENGLTSFADAADSPDTATALIAGWALSPDDDARTEKLIAAHDKLTRFLSVEAPGMKVPPLDLEGIDAKRARIRQIMATRPAEAVITATLPGAMFPGRQVWDTLHQVGLRWGDMDQYQWADTTGQTDYLVWVEAHDDALNYTLPERIAAGAQDFHAVHFIMDLRRTPAPDHVAAQMIGMARAFARATGADLVASVDGRAVDFPGGIVTAAWSAMGALGELGLAPGDDPVCRLV